MGIFSKLFGSDTVVDKGMDLVDKAFYTDQEEAADKIQRLSVKAALLKAYEPFKIAQRYMMIIVGVPYTSAWTITFIMSFFTDITQQELLLKGTMGTVFLAIASFYFGGGLIEGAIKAAKNN